MNNKITFILAVLLGAMISCKKSDDAAPPPVNEPKGFTIDLQTSAVAIGNIDSADVVFRLVGSNTRIKERLIKKENKLVASTKQLTAGTWNADVEIYTKTVNQLSHQYVCIKPVLITNAPTEIGFAGPGATNGNGWLKRLVKTSANNEVVLIVPEDVYDSYFEFRSRTNKKLLFGMQREAINVNYVVDEKSWACANNCPMTDGRLANNTHFMSFTEKIMSSPWTKTHTNMAVINEQSEIVLEYEKEWFQ